MEIDCKCKKKPSKTMILQNNCGKPKNSFVKFKDNFLKNDKEYKYLNV